MSREVFSWTSWKTVPKSAAVPRPGAVQGRHDGTGGVDQGGEAAPARARAIEQRRPSDERRTQ